MSDVKSHEPGTFCWFELHTTDAASAKHFYSELLGWSYDDIKLPDGGVYTMARIRGRDAAAITPMQQAQRDKGMPAFWNPYVAVKSVDESAQKAESLGGKIVMPAMDVMDSGRMAVLQDPSGAAFSLWQGNKVDGHGVEQEPGAFTWAELATRDVPKCRDFYTKLFDWGVHQFEGGAMPYWLFNANDKDRGGMMAMPATVPAQVPSAWTMYFVVSDCDGSVNRAQGLGGKLLVPAMEVPNTGRFAVLSDPQGGAFGILQQPAR